MKNRYKSRLCLLRVGCLMVIAMASPGRLPGGERIEFSTSKQRLELLQPGAMDPVKERRNNLNSKRPRNALDVLTDDISPSLGPAQKRESPYNSPQTAEANSWKNSWIFQTAGSLNRQATANEVFHVQETGSDGAPKKKQTAMDRYLQEKEGNNHDDGNREESAPNTTYRDNESQATHGKESFADRDGKSENDQDSWSYREDKRKGDPMQRMDSLLSDLFNPASRRGGDRAANSLKDPASTGMAGGVLSPDYSGDPNQSKANEQSRQQRNLEFKQLLDGRAAGANDSRQDSINSARDWTRTEVNPIAPRSYQNADRNFSGAAGNPAMSSAMQNANRAGAYDTMMQPSLPVTPAAPPVTQPVGPPPSRYQPAVLPIPRRSR